MSSPALLPTVESWIWPLGLSEFREHYWLQRAYVRDRGASALGAYGHIGPAAGDADDLEWFHTLGGRARVPIHAGGRLASVANVSLQEAIKFYRAGQTVYVTDAEPLIPSARALARTFDVPPSHVECNLYLSTRGCRTTPHFDATETFVIQLRGTKIWQLADNSIAPLPLMHWHLERPVPASIRNYVPGEWPSSMPADARTIVATPGMVMYVPRGTWHATETHEESLSAHVHYRTACWADLVQMTIHRELTRHRAWRRAALGLGEDPGERGRAAAELGPLLARLAEDLAGLTVSDLLGPLDSGAVGARAGWPEDGESLDAVRYKRVALASVGIESTSDDHRTKMVRFVVSGPLHERVTEYELPESFAPACLWVRAQSLATQFGVDDLVRLGPSRAEAREILPALEAAGVIERVGRA
ncbi:JmjC domain-containing protein [Pendulispora albinea]|uniref:Ribosomal oxygenase 2 n=1 Tax=Pendulispora albinea TaxID=2741071 RepID=A0ABZ2M2P7_9BACT